MIDGIEKNLKLTPTHVAASRHALYTYGNTSSSSIWYEMDYIQCRGNLKRGERVLQVMTLEFLLVIVILMCIVELLTGCIWLWIQMQ